MVLIFFWFGNFHGNIPFLARGKEIKWIKYDDDDDDDDDVVVVVGGGASPFSSVILFMWCSFHSCRRGFDYAAKMMSLLQASKHIKHGDCSKRMMQQILGLKTVYYTFCSSSFLKERATRGSSGTKSSLLELSRSASSGMGEALEVGSF